MRALPVVGCLLITCLLQPLAAQELDFPTDVFDTTTGTSTHEGHCVDVTTFTGVDKTGANDSTAGIQNAIAYMYIQNAGGVPRQETLYFPTGTYTISNTLDGMWTEDTTGNTASGSGTVTNLGSTVNVRAGNIFSCSDFPSRTFVKSVDSTTQITVSNNSTGTHAGIAAEYQSNVYRLHFVGQSESGVKLQLGTSVAGFTHASSPKAMIRTESDTGTATDPTNDAFDNCVWNMTLDTGASNPGAIGIDYLGNNCASIRYVTINAASGSGYAGLSMTRAYPGPCMIENVVINGFANGVLVGGSEYCTTFEGLTLNNQTTQGLSNAGNAVFIRNLTSNSSAPVINNGTGGLLVLVDSTATYTGSGTTT